MHTEAKIAFVIAEMANSKANRHEEGQFITKGHRETLIQSIAFLVCAGHSCQGCRETGHGNGDAIR